MGKETISVTVDTHLLAQARLLNINRSNVLNEGLTTLIAFKQGNMDKLDLNIIKKELKKVEKQKILLINEENELINQQKLCEKRVENAEKRRLLDQKEALEKEIRCFLCGELLVEDDLREVLKDGKVAHRRCFLYNYHVLKKDGVI